MGKRKSRREAVHQVLGVMSAQKAERFLCDLANLRFGPKGEASYLRRLFKSYPHIFPGDTTDPEIFTKLERYAVSLRNLLCKAWDAPDLRRREWYIYELEATYRKFEATGRKVQESWDLKKRLATRCQPRPCSAAISWKKAVPSSTCGP